MDLGDYGGLLRISFMNGSILCQEIVSPKSGTKTFRTVMTGKTFSAFHSMIMVKLLLSALETGIIKMLT